MKRLLALALALGMMLTVMSVGVFAAAATTQENPFTVPVGTTSYDNVTFTGMVSVAAANDGGTRQV
ncbi:MAG: hypothetical protein RR320_02645, partial [Oscillospiraceae bacterium]